MDDIVNRLEWDAEHIYDADTLRLYGDTINEIEHLRADRDRWRDLAEYLCRMVPSVVVPNEIASRFPDPLAVRGE